MNIVLIDDQPVICQGLESVLGPWRIRVAAADPGSWKTRVRQLRPRVVLLESRIGHRDGLNLLDQIINGDARCPVIVFSEFDNATFVARSVASGASDYILKSTPLSRVVSGIRRVIEGREASARSLFGKMKAFLSETPPVLTSLPDMTGREYQVLRHLGLGLSNREIGRSLDISVETVKEHVQNLLRKLNSPDRTHAAIQAIRNGVA